jgi:hypothetical protein
LGSVQAFHTRFSGASTTRVMTNSSPAVLAAGLGFALVAVTGLLLDGLTVAAERALPVAHKLQPS